MSRVNHELRTPLNAVIGFSEMMALEMFGPLGNARYQEYVRHIRDSADDLLKSAEDTMALTALLTTPAAGRRSRRLHARACPQRRLGVRRAEGRRPQRSTQPYPAGRCRGDRRAARAAADPRQYAVGGRIAGRPGADVGVLAVADGELIEIVLSVGSERLGTFPRAGSLAICLARTLLEMQGTSLLEIESAAGGWRAVTVLDRAVQHDFFAGRAAARSHQREREMAL